MMIAMHVLLLRQLRKLSRRFPPSVPHLVLFRTDLSIPSTTSTTQLRTPQVLKARSVIPIWLQRWLSTPTTTSCLRQVRLCWLRLTSPIRAFCLCYSKQHYVRWGSDIDRVKSLYTTKRSGGTVCTALFLYVNEILSSDLDKFLSDVLDEFCIETVQACLIISVQLNCYIETNFKQIFPINKRKTIEIH